MVPGQDDPSVQARNVLSAMAAAAGFSVSVEMVAAVLLFITREECSACSRFLRSRRIMHCRRVNPSEDASSFGGDRRRRRGLDVLFRSPPWSSDSAPAGSSTSRDVTAK